MAISLWRGIHRFLCLANGTPSRFPSPSKTFSPDYLNVINPSEIHRHIDQAYNELFSVGVQRELPWNMFTSVSYIHSS